MAQQVGFYKIAQLNSENYETWKIQMECLLIKVDNWKYVSGKCTRPTSDAEEQTNWDYADEKARADIILNIEPSQLMPIRDCKTSMSLWEKLSKIYRPTGIARKVQLMDQLLICKMSEDDDCKEFLLKFFGIVTNLRDLDIKIDEQMLSIMMLNALPSSFNSFAVAIKTRDELPSLEILRIKIEEESASRISVSNNPTDFVSTANVRSSRKETPTPKYTYYNKKCYICKKPGHLAEYCWKRTDYENRTSNMSACLAENLNVSSASDDSLILDSGCTTHMIKDTHRLCNFSSLKNKIVKLANDEVLNATGSGSLTFVPKLGNSQYEITVNALLVPNLKSNLISVTKLVDEGYIISFSKHKASAYKYDKLVFTASRKGNLFYINENTHQTCLTRTASDICLWHKRFGHLNSADLNLLIKEKLVYGIDCKPTLIDYCDTCCRCKQTKSSYKSVQKFKRNNEILSVIHSDLCGPMQTVSLGGNRYFLTFIDDATKFTVVYFLKNKNEALKCFKTYKREVENIFSKKIKYLQTDNGLEFASGEFQTFLSESGIKSRFTCPGTPEQNGTAERYNRTIVEMARCVLSDSGLPLSFWGEAIRYANYVRNRCPNSSIGKEIPFTAAYGRIPSVKHFRTFGCVAYMLNKNKKGKFAARSKKVIFVGYSDNRKAYRLYDPDNRKTYESRDVTFVENKTWTDEKNDDINENIILEKDVFRDDPNQCSPQIHIEKHQKRGKGRPFFIKTGKKGRPKKQFHIVADSPSVSEYEIEGEESTTGNTDVDANRNADVDANREDIENKSDNCENDKNKEYKSQEYYDYPENVGFAFLTFDEVMKGEYSIEWKNSIFCEYEAHLRNETWELVDEPDDENVLTNHFVFREKFKKTGELDKRKSRLVAHGNRQTNDQYGDSFSPTLRMESLRLLLAYAVQEDMFIHQMDVNVAYLNGTLNETLYMKQPLMLREALEELQHSPNPIISSKAKRMLRELNANKVCKLKKSIYGLKQSGRQWYNKLHLVLTKYNFTPTDMDPCIYVNAMGVFIAVYVDDLILAAKDERLLKEVKNELNEQFYIKDLGQISYCLGIEFNYDKSGLKMSQKGYVSNVLKKFGMENCKGISTPMEIGLKLGKPAESIKDKPYASVVGSLMYLATATRPDISFAVNYLSQFNHDHGEEHWKAVKRILRYIQATSDISLKFEKSNQPLIGYVDADWANDVTDRKSYTGYIFTYAGSPIKWSACKQNIVTLSTVEAEYIALSEATREAIFLRKFFLQLDSHSLFAPTIIHCDNQGAICISHNPVNHGRTKHIDVKHHFLRQEIEKKTITLIYIKTEDNVSDILTKPVSKDKLQKFTNYLKLT